MCKSILSKQPNELATTIFTQRSAEQEVLMNTLTHYVLVLLFFFTSFSYASSQPPIQLPTLYQQKHSKNIEQYWISEKLDGIRGYWNGEQLLTKSGRALNPPKWFTKHWPKTTIDGELWMGRNTFEQVMSCTMRKISGACWQDIRFMMFDLPKHTGNFSERLHQLKRISENTKSKYIQVIKQQKVSTHHQLFMLLDEIVNGDGEGLMLHHQSAYYKVGRHAKIMKLKRYNDAEATVLKHIEGKGKYQGLLGAIQVKTKDGIVFKIGSGFTNEERKNPPKIGSVITFKYIGKTQKGVPKFASFLRQRHSNTGNH